MAPEAKLAIYDYQAPGAEELYLPDNIYRDYYLHSFEEAGARINSNSWGNQGIDYDLLVAFWFFHMT